MKPIMGLYSRACDWLKENIRPVRGAFRSAHQLKCSCGVVVSASDWCGAYPDNNGAYDILCLECYWKKVDAEKNEIRAAIAEQKKSFLGYCGRVLSVFIKSLVAGLALVVIISALQVFFNGGVV